MWIFIVYFILIQVSFSMLEIYNEQVKDLLVKAKPQAGGLKIRQNPKVGFYVEGLKVSNDVVEFYLLLQG